MAKCEIPECELECPPRSTLTICPLCRASMYRWMQRRPAEVLERRRKLHMYDHRMEEIVDFKAQQRRRRARNA